jgi:hypothetical protein
MIANLTQNLSKVARVIGMVWHRLPITTVTVLLVLCAWFYSRVTISSAASAPPAMNLATIGYPPLALIQPMPVSFPPHVGIKPGGTHVRRGRTLRSTDRAHSEFRRKIVGQNEIDYVAKDVTIRLFVPAPASKPTRVSRGERIVRFGKDVTVRYFDDPQAPGAKTRPVVAATRSAEGSLAVSK